MAIGKKEFQLFLRRVLRRAAPKKQSKHVACGTKEKVDRTRRMKRPRR